MYHEGLQAQYCDYIRHWDFSVSTESLFSFNQLNDHPNCFVAYTEQENGKTEIWVVRLGSFTWMYPAMLVKTHEFREFVKFPKQFSVYSRIIHGDKNTIQHA